MANSGWCDKSLYLFVAYWIEVWKAWSVTTDLQFLWCVRSGLAEGVKAGSFTPTPPLDASPPIPFLSPMIWVACFFCVGIQSVVVMFIFCFLVHHSACPFHSFLCCRNVSTQPGASTSTISQATRKPPKQGHKVLEVGTRFSLKSVRLSEIDLVNNFNFQSHFRFQ